MRFNKAAALVAGASLVKAQEFCSDRSTIVVTEYVTLPGPVESTPVPSAPAESSVEAADETTSVQVVTIKPVPATSTPPVVTPTPTPTPSPPMTTSTIYTSTSSVNPEGEVVWQTISQYTTVCPVTESEAAATPVTTPTPEPSQWTTSTIFTTSPSVDATGGTVFVTVPHTTTVCPVTASETAAPVTTPEPSQWTTSTIYTTSASVDSTGGTVYVTVPHTTTVCPVTATEAPLSTISTTSKCKTTRTVTVDPEPVTVTVSPSADAAVDGAAVGAASAEPTGWTSSTVVAVETVVYSETAAAASTAVADGVVAAAAFEPSSSASPSVAVDTPVYTPAPAAETPAASATPAADAGVDGLTGFPSSGSVAVDTPVYTPAPAESTPAVAGVPAGSPSVAVDTPVYTPAAAAGTPAGTPSVAVDTPVYTPAPAESTPAAAGVPAGTPSVAVDTPVYTPAPASSTPAVSVEQAASSTPAAQSTFVTSSAPAASSSSSGGLVSTVGSTVTSLTETITGEASFYGGSVSGGTCSFTGYSLPSTLFGTALSGNNWDTAANCGACVNVKGPGGNTITAMIVDQCPECSENQLDLFEDAFTELSSAASGLIDIAWEIVECGITTPLQLLSKEGSSEYWFSMQVSNSNVPVKALHVSTDGGSTWTETTRSEYNFFEYESGFGSSLVDIKVTSSTGKEVITKNVTVGSGATHKCESNF